LIVAFIVAFVIVSAIVAFNGVPGQAASDQLDGVDVERGSAVASAPGSARRASRARSESAAETLVPSAEVLEAQRHGAARQAVGQAAAARGVPGPWVG